MYFWNIRIFALKKSVAIKSKFYEVGPIEILFTDNFPFTNNFSIKLVKKYKKTKIAHNFPFSFIPNICFIFFFFIS